MGISQRSSLNDLGGKETGHGSTVRLDNERLATVSDAGKGIHLSAIGYPLFQPFSIFYDGRGMPRSGTL